MLAKPCLFDGSTFGESCQRAHPDLNQGPADLQSAALTTELCTHILALDARACKDNTLHRFTREGIGSHSKMGTRIICSLHYRCAPRRFHDSVASTPRTHRNSALKIDKQGLRIWPHQQQAKETPGIEFGVNVCIFTFALAMIGKLFQARFNVLCNLDGFWMVFVAFICVGSPMTPSWLLLGSSLSFSRLVWHSLTMRQ